MRTRRLLITAIATSALALAGCGGDDSSGPSDPQGGASTTASSGAGTTTASGGAGTTASGGAGTTAGSSGGGGGGDGGTLEFGDQTIDFVSARCYLQEQDAAAGGGKILFVAQASGIDADGEEVTIDVSRYDEDSQFTGDKIEVVIGNPFSGDSISWGASSDLGTVEVDGNTVRADGLTFKNFDLGEEHPGSFEINC